MNTFGKAWSRALVDTCGSLSVPGYPVLPEWVLAVCALESGFDPLARNASGAFGLFQRMPPYDEADPIQQLIDYRSFTRQMRDKFAVGKRFESREALYVANLAPARLAHGQTIDTVLYSAPSRAYVMNAKAFGKEPGDPLGVLRLGDMSTGLDAAVKRCQARYNAEVEAAYAVNATS